MGETLGETLREAREENGASIEDAAAATRIMQTQLRAIEDNDYSAIPAPMYAKGFLKLYAQFLGLEAEPILERFQEECADPDKLRPSLSAHTKTRSRKPEPAPEPGPESLSAPEVSPDAEPVLEDPGGNPVEPESSLEGLRVDAEESPMTGPDPDEGLDKAEPGQVASQGSGFSSPAKPSLGYGGKLRVVLPVLFALLLVLVCLQLLRDRTSRTPETVAFTGLEIPKDTRVADPPEPYLEPAGRE